MIILKCISGLNLKVKVDLKNALPDLCLPSPSTSSAESLLNSDNHENRPQNETTEISIDDSNKHDRYKNIRTYSHAKGSPPRDLTIFDFQTIKTPKISKKATEKYELEASCSNCLLTCFS